MCKVFRRLSLHTSTNPKARTTIAPRGMPHELLHGSFVLEVFQVNQCGVCQSIMYIHEEEYFHSQFGMTCVLCFRALEIHGRVWE